MTLREPILRLLLLPMVLNFGGCVNPSAALVDEKGTRVTCQATGFGIISGTMANNRYEACVSEAQMRGFKFEKQQ